MTFLGSVLEFEPDPRQYVVVSKRLVLIIGSCGPRSDVLAAALPLSGPPAGLSSLHADELEPLSLSL